MNQRTSGCSANAPAAHSSSSPSSGQPGTASWSTKPKLPSDSDQFQAAFTPKVSASSWSTRSMGKLPG